MIHFARFAYFTLFRDASVFALAAALLMMCFSFSLPIAFDAGGVMMLRFAKTAAGISGLLFGSALVVSVA